MNKRGIFFTLLALVIVAIFLVSVTVFSNVYPREQAQRRVSTLDSFVKDVEEDLSRLLFTSGFRQIFLMQARILETGEYVSDSEGLFQEMFFNGTYNDQSYESILTGTTFSEIEEKLQQRAYEINANVSISNPSLTVDQIDPWNVRFVLTSDFYFEDVSGLAQWNKTLITEIFVPTSNFNDPVYLVDGNGFANKIERTPYSDFVSGSDVSNLLDHLDNSYYISSTTAPSFLDRLEGDLLANSVQGVESLVDLSEFPSFETKSVIDHIYFSSDNPTSCTVTPSGMPSWFRLDNANLATYEVACA